MRRRWPCLPAASPSAAEVSLRINDAKTRNWDSTDLAALVESGARPDALMLPKVAGADEIRAV